MNIINFIPEIYAKYILFVLVFTRISAVFATFIVFRRDIVNARILITLSAVLSVYVILFYHVKPFTYDVFSIQMTVELFFQTFVGFVAGFILNIVFEIFSALGQVISMQIGLSVASLFDPRMGSITTLTHFYMCTIILIFFFLNGHLFLMKMMIESFAVIPLDHSFIPKTAMMDILNYSGIIFSGSVMLSITIIVAVLLTNFALAIMTKFAPQFNLFSIGINMTLILGLLCVYLTFDLFVHRGNTFLEEGMTFLKTSLQKMT